MMLKSWLSDGFIAIFLIALMVVTRYHHFGDLLHLPDASMAVFFFAGFYRNKIFFGFLLVLAGLIDYLAITNDPSSSYCVSPAYIFLVPTYAVMWIIGRDLAESKQTPSFNLGKIPEFTAWLTLATILAFLISNASFYWLSGYFNQLSWLDYAVRVAEYLPTFVSSTLAYGLAGLLAICLLQTLLGRDAITRTDLDED